MVYKVHQMQRVIVSHGLPSKRLERTEMRTEKTHTIATVILANSVHYTHIIIVWKINFLIQ